MNTQCNFILNTAGRTDTSGHSSSPNVVAGYLENVGEICWSDEFLAGFWMKAQSVIQMSTKDTTRY